jgi:hypothetical protein
MVQHPRRRRPSSYSLSWKPEISPRQPKLSLRLNGKPVLRVLAVAKTLIVIGSAETGRGGGMLSDLSVFWWYLLCR